MPRLEDMPSSLARPEKAGAGRTAREETPLHIRFHGVDASEAFMQRSRKRVTKRLGRFAFHITRITVRLEDENGPKGGQDKLCRIKIIVPGAPTIVVQGRASDAYSAFDRALDAAAITLTRSLEKRGRGAPKAPPVEAEEPAEASEEDDERSPPPTRKPDKALRRRATMRTQSPAAKALRARTKHQPAPAWSREAHG